MYPLTTEKRNRKSNKKMFFFSTIALPYYKCIIFSSSSLSPVSSLFISVPLCYVAPSHWESYMCPPWVMIFCDACTIWSVWLTCVCAFCQLLFAHTHTHTHTHYMQCVHIYTTVQGHLIPASRPTHLGRLGGGAFEYTVVVWPQAPAWLACQRLCFSSSGQSASQCCQRPGYTAFLYLQTAAK